MTIPKKPPSLSSDIRSISTVSAPGAYGDPNAWGTFAYGRRASDNRRVRCKRSWDRATGITTISSYLESSQFTQEEWSQISGALNTYDQCSVSNRILDARKQPKP